MASPGATRLVVVGRGLGGLAPQAALAAAKAPVFVDTVHPNRAGHAIIAGQLRQALEAAGLVSR